MQCFCIPMSLVQWVLRKTPCPEETPYSGTWPDIFVYWSWYRKWILYRKRILFPVTYFESNLVYTSTLRVTGIIKRSNKHTSWMQLGMPDLLHGGIRLFFGKHTTYASRWQIKFTNMHTPTHAEQEKLTHTQAQRRSGKTGRAMATHTSKQWRTGERADG